MSVNTHFGMLAHTWRSDEESETMYLDISAISRGAGSSAVGGAEGQAAYDRPTPAGFTYAVPSNGTPAPSSLDTVVPAITTLVEMPHLNPNDTLNASMLTSAGWWNNASYVLNDGYNNTNGSDVIGGLDSSSLSLDLVHAVVTGVILSALIFMTICGNVLVLLAVFVNSHLRSTTNYFIVNLAIADLLLGTTVLPFSAVLEVIPYWPFGSFFCDIWAAMDVLCCTASILSLCVISIDRYIGVTRPLQHSTILTEKRAFYITIIVWALSVTISVAPLLGWKEPPHPDPKVCQVTKQLGYVLFSVSGSFYIPLIIILVVYFRVYREALSQSRFLATGIKTSKTDESNCEVTLRIHKGGRTSNTSNSNNPYQSSSSSEHSEGSNKKNHSRMTLAGKVAKFKREKKAAKTLGIVVGVFIMCWFPFFFILPLGELCIIANR